MDGSHLSMDRECGVALYGGDRGPTGAGTRALEARAEVIVAGADDLAALDEDGSMAGGERGIGGLGEALREVAIVLGRGRLLLHFGDFFVL